MFINCPHCHALIATDPATDRPPQRCPRCAVALREADAPAPAIVPGIVAPGSVAGQVAASAVATPAPGPVDTPASTDDAGGVPGVIVDETIDDSLPESADSIVEAMLGPAGLEVEIARDNERGESARAPAPAEDANADIAPAPDASPLPDPAHSLLTPAIHAPRSRHGKHAPSFARAKPAAGAAPRSGRWKAIVAVGALSSLLVLQLLLADRAQLAGDARWRPMLSALCGVLRCTLPPWREPAAFTLLNRDVRPHPGVPGALRVNASFRNDARWPQPWPRLQLTLSDVDGRVAGTRSFIAREYLGGAPTQEELTSGQSATVTMDILEPAANIVAFTFEFR